MKRLSSAEESPPEGMSGRVKVLSGAPEVAFGSKLMAGGAIPPVVLAGESWVGCSHEGMDPRKDALAVLAAAAPPSLFCIFWSFPKPSRKLKRSASSFLKGS